MTYQVKKPVSKFAFQVHNLRRYSEAAHILAQAGGAKLIAARDVVGLCRLNQVDPYPITHDLSNP